MQKKGFHAVTLCTFFNLNFRNKKRSTKRKLFDLEGIERIVFDEIFLYDPRILGMIKNFVIHHNDIQILATGDIDQLQPISCEKMNINNVNEYMKKCIRSIFPNQLILKENKRLKSVEDRNKLKQLKEDIFNLKLDIIDVFKKHGFRLIHNMDELETLNSISYFRYRNHIINNWIQEHKIKVPTNSISHVYKDDMCHEFTHRYYKNQEIVCKLHHIGDNGRLYVNYHYKIKSIDFTKREFTICDMYDEDNQMVYPMFNGVNEYIEEIKTKKLITQKRKNGENIQYQPQTNPIEMNKCFIPILKHFSLPYCNTCHSNQGVTIEDKFTIFDCNTAYTDRNYVWTALTRASDFNNVTIFEHNEKDCRRLEFSKIKQYYGFKIQNYITQDENAHRINNDLIIPTWFFDENEKYITPNWIIQQNQKQENQCYYCHQPFSMEIENGKVHSDLTVDRLNNKYLHTENNCVLSCVSCNRARK